jgi:hypothetical protein
MCAQFYEGESSGVLALAAVSAVEIRIIDVRQGCRFKFGVFHRPTVAPACCGLLLYKSYSVRAMRTLYNSKKRDAAPWLGAFAPRWYSEVVNPRVTPLGRRRPARAGRPNGWTRLRMWDSKNAEVPISKQRSRHMRDAGASVVERRAEHPSEVCTSLSQASCREPTQLTRIEQ